MPPPPVSFKSPPLSADASTRRADILWVYLHLDDPTVTREATPAGRWNLLEWARAEPARFYRYLLPKAITNKPVTPATVEVCRTQTIEELSAIIDEVAKPGHPKAYDATPELIADVRALLEEWSTHWELKPADACLTELSNSLAGWISTATQHDATWVDQEISA